jgi:hypothetical protein
MNSREFKFLVEDTYKICLTQNPKPASIFVPPPPLMYCRSYLVVKFLTKFCMDTSFMPNPVAAKSKAWICDCSLAEIAGSNPARHMDVSGERYLLSGRDL